MPHTLPVIDSHFRSALYPLWYTPVTDSWLPTVLWIISHIWGCSSICLTITHNSWISLPKDGVQTPNSSLLCSQDSGTGLGLPQSDASLWTFDSKQGEETGSFGSLAFCRCSNLQKYVAFGGGSLSAVVPGSSDSSFLQCGVGWQQ